MGAGALTQDLVIDRFLAHALVSVNSVWSRN